MRKPRSDSVLANLQPQQRDALADELLDGMSYEDAVEWLHMEYGVKSSASAMGGFYQHFCAPLRLRRAAEAANALPELSGGLMADWDVSSVALVKQLYFETLAAPSANPESLFFLCQQIGSIEKGKLDREKLEFNRRKHAETTQLKTETLALQRERFETDTATAALKFVQELKTIASNRALTEPAKIDAVRKRLFGVAPQTPEGT